LLADPNVIYHYFHRAILRYTPYGLLIVHASSTYTFLIVNVTWDASNETQT